MDIKRFNERKKQFIDAFAEFKEGCLLPESKLARDAVIKRLEFTYELAWKVLKLWLEAKGIDARNPRDVLKEAFVQNMIVDGEAWIKLLEYRNLTSHTYDKSLAEEVYHFAKLEALPLFEALLFKLNSKEASL